MDNGDVLAGLSRSGSVLQDLGYDPDEVRANPAMRAEVMSKLSSPLAATPPVQIAQNSAPPNPRQQAAGIPANPNPLSPNGNSLVTAPGQPRLFNRVQPTAPAAPPPASLASGATPTPLSMATGVSPSVAPVTPAPITPAAAAAPGNAPDVTNARTAAANLLAPEPTTPDTTADDATIAAKSAAIDPHQNQYKEGFWGEVGRGLNNFRYGFGDKPEKEVDYGAPNSQYGEDEATRKNQLANATTDRSNLLDKFKQAVDLRKQQDTASDDAGKISNTTAGIPIDQQKADADTQNAATNATEASYKSPEGRAAATAAEFTAAQAQADKLGLKGMSRTLFLANGKIPDPRQATPEEIAAAQATRVFTQENGHPPQTLEDFNKVRMASQGKLDSAAAGGADPALVDSIGTGKIAPDRLGYLLAKNPALISAVAQKYPDFDSSKIAAYPQVYKDFTSSKPNTAGGTLNAAATAFKHLSELQELNTAESRIPGTEDYQKFQNKLDTVAPELAKAYNDSTVSGIETYKKSLGAMFNRDAAIQTQAKSLGDKVDSLEQTWRNAAPSRSYQAPVPGMDDAAMQARAKLDSRYSVPSKPGATFNWDDHPVVKP